jgi:tetraacyldisaccharide 4'-kinase
LFDLDILPSLTYDLPVISVGNLTVGGTGKTPMTEYLVDLLVPHHQVAVLSRGYKRLSKGLQVATPQSGPDEIGDEPAQIFHKHPTTILVVDANRRNGLDTLTNMREPTVEAVVMDDAYQHRYVQPGLSILLMDYNRPLGRDFLLPAGNLREPASQTKRADILIFTKCPPDLRPIERRLMVKNLKQGTHQSVFFTTMVQTTFQPLINPITGKANGSSEDDPATKKLSEPDLSEHPVLIIAGIADPHPFVSYVQTIRPDAQTLLFPDHHRFNDKDIAHIKTTFEPMMAEGGVIVTTEKDGVRLRADIRLESLWPSIYLAPITLRFLDNESALFNKKILDYVRINKRHSRVDQTTHAQ